MMGPEAYYHAYLEGKTEDEVLIEIDKIREEIIRLKNVMEHPEYEKCEIVRPSEETQLWCNRLYLERAKETLVEVGGVYELTPEEIVDAEFQKNISFINRIKFSMWRCFDVCEPGIYDVTGNTSMLEKLSELHIGEWLDEYDLSRFRYYVLDGIQWEVEISFSNGHEPIRKVGRNDYPYNFKAFCEVMEGNMIQSIRDYRVAP